METQCNHLLVLFAGTQKMEKAHFRCNALILKRVLASSGCHNSKTDKQNKSYEVIWEHCKKSYT